MPLIKDLLKKKTVFYSIVLLVVSVLVLRFRASEPNLPTIFIVMLIIFSIGFLVARSIVSKRLTVITTTTRTAIQTAIKGTLATGLCVSPDRSRLSKFELEALDKALDATLKKEINMNKYNFLAMHLFYFFIFGIALFVFMMLFFFSNPNIVAFFISLIRNECI